MTVSGVFDSLWRRPHETLIRRWNWKAAVLSSAFRATLFLAVNVTAGWRAALGAMGAEFVYRALTAGFHGAITQNFRGAEPPWLAAVSVSLVLPAASHSIEFAVHWLRGTPNLRASVLASLCFTVVSTLFNWYAMRRGVLIVGSGSRSMAADFRAMPAILAGFLSAGPRLAWRRLREAAAG